MNRFSWARDLLREGEGNGSGGTGDAPAGAGGTGGAGTTDPGPAGASNNEPSALAAAAAAAKPATTDGSGDAAKSGEGDKKPAEDEVAADPNKPAEPAKPDEPDVPKGVDGKPIPEKYDVTMPDGFQVDEALLNEVTPTFREAKLSQDQTQTILNEYARIEKTRLDEHAKTVQGWLDRSKSDPEIGGAGWEQNLAVAGNAFHTFGDPELMQVFDTYGLGNHPAVLKFFTRVGKATGEAPTVGGSGGGGRLTTAEVFYPSMAKKA